MEKREKPDREKRERKKNLILREERNLIIFFLMRLLTLNCSKDVKTFKNINLDVDDIFRG